MNTNINNVTWYNAYVNLRTLGANENVKVNIIHSNLWKKTVQWFNKTEEEISNSESWGNYLASEFDYTDVNGDTKTKLEGESVKIPTGASEHNKANNIYDMAGNVMELTLDAYEGENSARLLYRWVLCIQWILSFCEHYVVDT